MVKPKKHLLFLLAGSLLLSACGGDKRPPEEIVTERFNQRWQLISSQQYEKAYAFISPANKQLINEKDYVNEQQNGFFIYALPEIKSVDCKKNADTVVNFCQVEFYIMAKRRDSQTSYGTFLKENWVLEDKNWWFIPQS